MCGISGVVGHDGGAVLVERMNSCLAGRGPDAEGLESWPAGVASLGHRRLSIFDLSELGRQPMVTPDREIGLVFNGAVYNFHQLRVDLEKEGYRFKSTSDTEVILYGYKAWGVDKLKAHAPLQRLGDDEDLKGLCVLYASDAGKHITGQWLAVDGGVSCVTGG